MFKKKITWFIIIVIILGVGGILYSRSRAPKVDYTTEDAKRGDLFRTVSVTGTLKAVQESDLSFEVNGTIKKILVKVGDDVKAGQMLAYLDQQKALSDYRQYQVDLKTKQEALDLARRHWDDLKPEEKATDKLAVEKARAALDGAYRDMKKTILYAPFSGKISKVDISEGEGATLNVEAMQIIGDGGMEIESDVPESDIAKLALDQTAKITFDALDQSDVFEAKVSHIDLSSTVIQDVVYYKIKLTLARDDSRLKSGMSCDIDVNTAEARNTLMIPERAIKTEGEKKYVEILGADSKVSKKYVETGLSGDDGMIEIKNGLAVGEKVITFTK